MFEFGTMIILFVLGYTFIALEHPIKIDKAATALLTGSILWAFFALNAGSILNLGFSPMWIELPAGASATHFIVEQLEEHLVEIAEILFFLLGAMTIVEIVDQHEGFKVITDRIQTQSQVNLLWITGLLAFFLSAVLDNLTTTIVMIALLRKLIDDKKVRWFFASMVVLAANAGGAWSPIGDVTTIMLWIGGQITTLNIIKMVFLPSLVTLVVPLCLLSFKLKGEVGRPAIHPTEGDITNRFERRLVFSLGLAALLFVPVFKTVTHLPPFVGMLFGLGTLWVITEIIHRKKPHEHKKKLVVSHILKRVDTPTILFFLGILSAVAALQSAGHLFLLSGWLDKHIGNIFGINLAIGFLSSIVDNVPLVAGAMGMYQTVTPDMIAAMADPAKAAYLHHFMTDGAFWEFLAYCAGTGGSMLIIGSAAGVAAMGMEKIDFIWYLKRISFLALLGYLAGAGVYYLQIRMVG